MTTSRDNILTYKRFIFGTLSSIAPTILLELQLGCLSDDFITEIFIMCVEKYHTGASLGSLSRLYVMNNNISDTSLVKNSALNVCKFICILEKHK